MDFSQVQKIAEGSTGPIFKLDNKVYKKSTNHEMEIYNALSQVNEVLSAESETIDGIKYIVTDYQRNIISIDTIPVKQRNSSSLQSIIIRNSTNIHKAISALTNIGYDYSDQLQFIYDDKMKLFDFSSAHKPEQTGSIADLNVLEENYFHLTNFYRTFGLDGIANIISKSVLLKSLIEDPDLGIFLEEDIQETSKKLHRQGIKPNNIYYSSNSRFIQVGNILQTEPIEGIVYVYSEKPLSNDIIDEWELNTVYTQD